MMTMTCMKVRGHQRSNGVNFALCYQTWSEEPLIEVYGGDDLHEGQRSSEVKGDKLCTMITKLGQKNRGCKFKMMMAFKEVKHRMGSNTVNYVPWLQPWSEDH